MSFVFICVIDRPSNRTFVCLVLTLYICFKTCVVRRGQNGDFVTHSHTPIVNLTRTEGTVVILTNKQTKVTVQ